MTARAAKPLDIKMSEIPQLDTAGKFAKSIKAMGECVRCKFSTHEGSDLVCRRNPPMATVVMSNKFGQAVPQVMTAFPVIRPDMWCGEFVTSAPAVSFAGTLSKLGDGPVIDLGASQ
jgi:hypothetical protein